MPTSFRQAQHNHQCVYSSALVAQLAERTAVNREAIGSNPIRSAYTRLAQSVERWPFKPVAEGSSPSAGGRALGLEHPRVACICLAQLVERTTLNRVVRGSTPRVDALFFVLLGMRGKEKYHC